ncbi:MAG: hypothetical protein MJ252_18065 [archaeon]|nr:hypothetical protein [archaeon]
MFVEPALGLAELTEDSPTALKTRSFETHKMIQWDTETFALKDGRLLINGNGYFTVLNKDLTALDFMINKDIEFLKVLRNGKLIAKEGNKLSLYEIKEKDILLYKTLDLSVKGLYEAESLNGEELVVINKGKFHFFNSNLDLTSSVVSNYSKKRNSKLNCLLLRNNLLALSYSRENDKTSVGLEIWDIEKKECLKEGEFTVDDNEFLGMIEFKEDYLIFHNTSIYLFNLRTFQVETVIEKEVKHLIELRENIFIGSNFDGEGSLIKFGPMMEINCSKLPTQMKEVFKLDDHRFVYSYIKQMSIKDLLQEEI